MKKTLASVIVGCLCACLLAGCACKHEWLEASCTAARICAECEATEGEPLGHDWVKNEGCTLVCSRCGSVDIAHHTWADATCIVPQTCTVCGFADSTVYAEHQWLEATETAPKTCSVCRKQSGISLGEAREEDYSRIRENGEKLVADGKYAEAIFLLDEAWKQTEEKEFYDIAARYRFAFGNYQTMVLAAGKNNSAVLNKDGTVSVVGRNDNGELAAENWTDIKAISLGDKHIVGLKHNGEVVAAGSNSSGRCNVVQWKNIAAISAGDGHTVALDSDGRVLATGYDEFGQCQTDVLMSEAGEKRIVAVAAGHYHTVALLEDGTAVACGDNRFNACNVKNWTDLAAVYAGSMFTAGLKTNGTVVVTGQSVSGWNVSEWTDMVGLAAGDSWLTGIRADGTVVSVGIEGAYLQECHRTMENWKNIAHVAVGFDQTVAMDSEGKIFCAGVNNFGQCDLQEGAAAQHSGDGEIKAEAEYVIFDRYMDYEDEYANVLGMSADGEPVWIYMTDHMGEYQDHSRIDDIGQFGELYFIREDQCITALDCATGQAVWQHKGIEGKLEKRNTDSEGNTHIVGYSHDIYVAADGKQGCAAEDGTCKQHSNLKPVKPGKTVTQVRFDYFMEGEPGERGNFVGLDKNKVPVWIYRTSQNDVPQNATIMEIGKYGNSYYFLDCGKITALDIKTGKILWQNDDVVTGGISSVIDTNGTIYLCGALGPDFAAVDAKGNTLTVIGTFDENYMWPYAIEKKSGKLHIKFGYGPESETYESFLITVNPRDFSYKIVGGIDPY
jgi:alpha-tubulin suppressor-like RCC1 family protein